MAKEVERVEKRVGTAATRAKNKYAAANYDRVALVIKKGRKEYYKSAAAAAGYSMNEFIIKAMDRLAAEVLGE